MGFYYIYGIEMKMRETVFESTSITNFPYRLQFDWLRLASNLLGRLTRSRKKVSGNVCWHNGYLKGSKYL